MGSPGQLEQLIRQRAINKAKATFELAMNSTLSPGWSMSYSDKFSSKDWDEFRRLQWAFFDTQIAPKVADKAVHEFLASYEKLREDFPDFFNEHFTAGSE